MRKRIDGPPGSGYDGGQSRFVRISQIQAGPTPLGGQQSGTAPQGGNPAAIPGTTGQTEVQQDVLDKRNLDQYRKTLANLETQVTEYKRMITQLEQRIIARGQGR